MEHRWLGRLHKWFLLELFSWLREDRDPDEDHDGRQYDVNDQPLRVSPRGTTRSGAYQNSKSPWRNREHGLPLHVATDGHASEDQPNGDRPENDE